MQPHGRISPPNTLGAAEPARARQRIAEVDIFITGINQDYGRVQDKIPVRDAENWVRFYVTWQVFKQENDSWFTQVWSTEQIIADANRYEAEARKYQTRLNQLVPGASDIPPPPKPAPPVPPPEAPPVVKLGTLAIWGVVGLGAIYLFTRYAPPPKKG